MNRSTDPTCRTCGLIIRKGDAWKWYVTEHIGAFVLGVAAGLALAFAWWVV